LQAVCLGINSNKNIKNVHIDWHYKADYSREMKEAVDWTTGFCSEADREI
jgi:hypothetical protein